MTKIKEICLNISSLGKLGQHRLIGGLIASFAAIPIVFILNFFAEINLSLFYILLLILLILSFGITQLALMLISDKDPGIIVLDKVVGLAAVFIYVPLTIKFILVGFVLFHILNFLLNYLIMRFVHIDIERLPGAIGILISDILSGLVINLFLRLIIWIAR
jgi:phosphatidylglycerophosphatase A